MGANAVTTVPVYTAGEVLTAADMNITNSGIPVFATTTTRDAAFGGTGEKTLAEGQFAYIEATNTTQYYDGAAWQSVAAGVVQVKSTTKTDTFTMSGTTFTDVTGVSVTVTPTSASNKVLVEATINVGINSDNSTYVRLLRDSTVIAVGATAGSRIPITAGAVLGSNASPTSVAFSFLDSPASTSAIAYKIQVRSQGSTLVAINRSGTDTDSTDYWRGISTITAMEVTP